jgi:hypothetical protein
MLRQIRVAALSEQPTPHALLLERGRERFIEG